MKPSPVKPAAGLCGVSRLSSIEISARLCVEVRREKELRIDTTSEVSFSGPGFGAGAGWVSGTSTPELDIPSEEEFKGVEITSRWAVVGCRYGTAFEGVTRSGMTLRTGVYQKKKQRWTHRSSTTAL